MWNNKDVGFIAFYKARVQILLLAVLKSRDKISVLCTQALSLPDINPKDMNIRTRLNFLLVILGSSEILKFHLLSLNSLCSLGDLNENFVENEDKVLTLSITSRAFLLANFGPGGLVQ